METDYNMTSGKGLRVTTHSYFRRADLRMASTARSVSLTEPHRTSLVFGRNSMPGVSGVADFERSMHRRAAEVAYDRDRWVIRNLGGARPVIVRSQHRYPPIPPRRLAPTESMQIQAPVTEIYVLGSQEYLAATVELRRDEWERLVWRDQVDLPESQVTEVAVSLSPAELELTVALFGNLLGPDGADAVIPTLRDAASWLGDPSDRRVAALKRTEERLKTKVGIIDRRRLGHLLVESGAFTRADVDVAEGRYRPR